MIHNFVNLVSWHQSFLFVKKNKMNKNNFFYCDSISFYFLFKIFKKNVFLNPGSGLKKNILKETKKRNSFFLISKKSTKYNKNFLVIDNFRSEKDIKIYSKRIFKNLYNLKDKKLNIFIGIASPKQNVLANYLFLYFKNCEIFCVGAVLDDIIEENNMKYLIGTEWFFRAINNPIRFFQKIFVISKEFITLLFNKKKRLLLFEFHEKYLKTMSYKYQRLKNLC